MFKFDNKKIPNTPGVYLFKDEKSNIVYVGKAKNLKNRVKSYFLKNQDRLYKKHLIVDSIFDIETISTNSEKEALILESNMIKKYKPKYNVLLKDNSEYCFLKINKDPRLYVPEISIVRRKTEIDLENKSSNKNLIYFGPYTSKKDLLNVLRIISKVFPYQCQKIKTLNNKKVQNKLSPCFNYYIKRCAGICCGDITRDEYMELIDNIINFFSGNIKELKDYLNSKMLKFSDEKKYEQALIYKNRILLLESVVDKQYARTVGAGDMDILSLYLYNDIGIVNIFNIKNGVLLNKKNFIIDLNNSKLLYDNLDDDVEVQEQYRQNIIEEFINQNYISQLDFNFDKTIVVDDSKFIDDKIFLDFNIKIRKYNKPGEKSLLDMGTQNAIFYINKNQINFEILEKIKDKLELNDIPKRIECFDISNIQGKFAVGSMSVFIDGLPKTSEYRKFKIKIENEPNDVGMMREVLSRRLSYKNLQNWGVPNLIVIDGGLGQLDGVLSVFNDIKKNKKLKNYLNKINIVSLAKREEDIFYFKSEHIKKVSAKKLYILRQIRDEAHRFGIGYFRARYRKQFKK